jgi:hypothetical protein
LRGDKIYPAAKAGSGQTGGWIFSRLFLGQEWPNRGPITISDWLVVERCRRMSGNAGPEKIGRDFPASF